ncbi:MAG: glycosyltransferase [Myxococcales bacterium]|nr:hypothetical protein [Myxococcota bacterium]MDW8281217.1 glycosyltransferase [Myxococcales bacterium]
MSAASSEATAVLVTVGTSLDPFDRLLRWVDLLCAQGRLPGPVFAQSGSCRYVPRHFKAVPMLPAPELLALIAAAGAVVCHGGAGSIGTCLQLGRRPVVVPRRAAEGEVVNDHQLELCRRLAAQGRILLAEDPEALARGVALALREAPLPPQRGGERLRQEIARLLSTLASRR